MSKRTIAILRGGPSSEHDVSLSSGQSIINILKQHHNIVDVVIDKKGKWHSNGQEVDPAKAVRMADVVFNTLHGEYGEDGEVQQILQALNKPFTGPRAIPAGLSLDKIKTKQKYAEHGLRTPHAKILKNTGDIHQMALELFRNMPLPMILKPIKKGSSVGIHVARDFADLIRALESMTPEHDEILVEELIRGKEATVGVVEGFRNESLYPLLPIEVKIPSDRAFYDYTARYGGATEHVCPGCFNESEKIAMQEAAQKAHEILGLRHYSATDFIIHPTRGLYVLETDSIPSFTGYSLFPVGLEAVGSSHKDFLEHIIELAFSGK